VSVPTASPPEAHDVSRATSRGSAALALAVSIALAAWVAWPAPWDGSAVIGHWNHPDLLSNHWVMVWVADSVIRGESLLWTDAYYWPIGDRPLFSGNANQAFLYVPFHALFGWPRGMSVYAFVVLVAAGMAGWYSARRAGAGPEAAAVAAAAYGTSPYVLQEMGSGRFAQSDVTWLGLSLGWLVGMLPRLRRGEVPRRWEGVLFGATAGVCAALYWYYGPFLAIGSFCLAVPHFVVSRAVPWRAAAEWIAAAALVVSPPLAMFVLNWSSIPGTGEDGAFPHREAWGDSLAWTLPFGVRGTHQAAALAFVVAALAIGGIGVLARRDRDGRVLATQLFLVAVVAVLAARGPMLFGDAPDVYTVLYGWSKMTQRFWWPSRHLVLAHWAIAVLAALGATALLERVRAGAPRWCAAAAMCAGVPLSIRIQDDVGRLPISTFHAPAFYQEIADLPPGPLLELPISPRLGGSQQLLVYQYVHGRKLVTGHAMWVDRIRPDAWDAWVDDNSFLRALTDFENGRSAGVAFEAGDLLALRAQGLRFVTHNREYAPRALNDGYADVLRALFGKPVVDAAGRARCYDLERWSGLTEVRAAPVLYGSSVTLSNGYQPWIGPHVESLGFHLLRDNTKMLAGVHPTHTLQPTPNTRPE
jgi:hypothetical protein